MEFETRIFQLSKWKSELVSAYEAQIKVEKIEDNPWQQKTGNST